MAAAGKRALLDNFALVALEPGEGRAPRIAQNYGASVDVPIPKDVSQFCFPDADHLVLSDASGIYTFVLTDDAGQRQFGFCLRRMLPSQGREIPCCLCILSHCAFFGLFTAVLGILDGLFAEVRELDLESATGFPPATVCGFLEALLRHPFPLPGESFCIQSVSDPTEYRLVCDDDENPLANASFHTLVGALPVASLVDLFAAMLCERRIVIVSKDLSMLSSCVHAAASTLYPFQWQHIFIPVLPKKLLDYCCAPMPFVVGVQAAVYPQVTKLPIEEVFFVNLDEGTTSPTDDLTPLPAVPATTLRASLERIVAVCKKNGSSLDTDAIAETFLQFFLSLFSDFRRFMRVSGTTATFDKEGFLASRPAAARPFMETFRHSQMFERFVAEREKIALAQWSGDQPALGVFDLRLELSGPSTSPTSSMSGLRTRFSALSGKMQDMKKGGGRMVDQLKTSGKKIAAKRPKSIAISQGLRNSTANLTSPKMSRRPKSSQGSADVGTDFSSMAGSSSASLRTVGADSAVSVSGSSRYPINLSFADLHQTFSPEHTPPSSDTGSVSFHEGSPSTGGASSLLVDLVAAPPAASAPPVAASDATWDPFENVGGGGEVAAPGAGVAEGNLIDI